jgi:alpha-beta hydrolase superfamily lysophospholipase
VRVVKLAYRTVRSDGTETVSTATAYLPSTPRALPAPIILVGRSTSGLADACAPSKDALPQANFAMPFAARGFVTITPDFAGLGNEGTHAYLDNHEAATELFDAALALQKLVPGAVGAPVADVGYSQGGGTVLSAQALELALTGTHTLRAVAAIAPEWPISPRSFGYEDVLRHPEGFTGFAGLSPPVVTVARHYGYAANKLGASHAGDTFPAAKRASITSALESRCTVALGGQLNAQEPKLGDLVDDAFRQQVLACIDGTAGCTGPGAAFHAWMTADFVTADAAGAPVLIAQGLADQVMPAAGEAACVVDKLQAEGITPAICSDSTATHDSVLERRIEDVVGWIEATVDGVAPPTCDSQFLPACSR